MYVSTFQSFFYVNCKLPPLTSSNNFDEYKKMIGKVLKFTQDIDPNVVVISCKEVIQYVDNTLAADQLLSLEFASNLSVSMTNLYKYFPCSYSKK